MNKTVNINLAGIFFHIDEDAFQKLQRYLDAIKRSFTDSQGRDEIISDIETRISELFGEKIKDERQVIGIKEVEEVIEVMGQPEDYHIDEEIFEDEPQSSYEEPSNTKKLFRDTSNSYVGGVSSGIGHYFGIEPNWIRLAWIFFTIFSSGAFLLFYIALWIFVPEAITTAEKLAMRGKSININNIEQKIKEGFNDVADKMKGVDYQKYSDKVKNNSTNFFDTLGDILVAFLKVFVKVIGIFLVFTAGVTLISSFIGFFTVGTFGFIEGSWIENFEVGNTPDVPVWLLSILAFLSIAIPFFFLLILGLKILIKNLKSIGTPAKLGLFGLWIFSIIGLSIIALRQATQEAFDAKVITEEKLLPITNQDTLQIRMVGNNRYIKSLYQKRKLEVKRDDQGNRLIVTQDIELFLKPSNSETQVKIEIEKKAEGRTYEEARNRAEELKYLYTIEGTTLLLDGFALTDYANKYRDQEVKITLILPEGITVIADDNTSRYNNSWKYDDYLAINGQEENYLTLLNGKFVCKNCPKEDPWKNEDNDDPKYDKEEVNIRINSDKDEEDFKLKIDDSGVHINSEPVKVEINENGVEIKTEK